MSVAQRSSDAREALVGTYKLLAMTTNLDDGTVVKPMGELPSGYIIITPTRFTAILAAEHRQPGGAIAEQAALLQSFIAYSGLYEIEGAKIITDVDISWNQSWTGSKQGRTFHSKGKRLTLVSDRAPSPFDPSRSAVAQLEWEKVE